AVRGRRGSVDIQWHRDTFARHAEGPCIVDRRQSRGTDKCGATSVILVSPVASRWRRRPMATTATGEACLPAAKKNSLRAAHPCLARGGTVQRGPAPHRPREAENQRARGS